MSCGVSPRGPIRDASIVACDTLPSEAQLHEDRAGAIRVHRAEWLMLRHAVFGIWSDFSETNRRVERVSCGQELQTFQPDAGSP
jgi:hypothetical protein